MKRLISVLILFFSISAALFGQNPPKVQYGPWVQNVTEDGFTVIFTTESNMLAHVEVAPDDGSSFEAMDRPKYYQTIAGRRANGTHHIVRVDGLEANENYRYRVVLTRIIDDSYAYSYEFGKSRTQKEIGPVRTKNPEAKECNFVMYSDIHNDEEKFKNLSKGIEASKIDYLVFNGDMASHMTSADSLIKNIFQPIKHLTSIVPTVYARGNHEGRGREWWKFPLIFPTDTGEPYYTMYHGPVAFLILDGGEDKPDNNVAYSNTAMYDEFRAKELEWLKEEVKKPEFVQSPVKIVFIHIPPIKQKSSWYSQLWLNEHFVPVLNEAGVDLVLSGHHHKHIYMQPGSCGNEFPILINSHVDRMDVKVTADKINIKTVSESGELVKTYNFSPR